MRVVIVGLGGIGQRHVRNLRALVGDRAQITAVRSRGRQDVLSDRLQIVPGQQLEAAYAIRRAPDLEAALAERPQLVIIANPSSLHLPAALAAARAGCALFIEKPLSHTLEGVDELVQAVERKRLAAVVGYQMRFHPCFRLLAEAVARRAVGRVAAVRVEVGEYLPGWHTYEDYRQMYAARAELGGGVILSQIHEFDYLYRLFGMPRRAFTVGGRLSGMELDVEDTASTLLEYDGPQGRWPVHVHQDYLQRPPARSCQVIGDAGKLIVDFAAPAFRRYDGSGALAEERTFPDFERNATFLDEMRHVLACVEGRETPQVTVRDGAQSLRIALAAKQSMETGGVVELDAVGSVPA